MSFVSEILDRSGIREITEFLMYGAKSKCKDDRSCEERIRKAEGQLSAWISNQFPDGEEQDRVLDVVMGAVAQTSEAYLELGLKSGILLAAQFYQDVPPNRQKGETKCRVQKIKF